MRILISGLYILFIIAAMVFLPTITIPMMQEFGLQERDVVGFAVTSNFMALLLLLIFGEIIWRETER